MRTLIRGGRVIDPANRIDAVMDVYIANGVIAAVGHAPAGFAPESIIDAHGRIVCSGLVDLRTRLREPGQEFKATIASETKAAAASGITTVCVAPDTTPVIDNPAVVDMIHQRAAASDMARVKVIGALTQGLEGKQIAEMLALKEAGCVGVGNGLAPVTNSLVMRRAMEYAASHDLTVFIHPEDAWLRGSGCAHEGPMSTRLGLGGIPEIAETIAVARDLALAERAGARIHFGALSSTKAVRMVARARHDGLPVTADVTAHHLHLTDMDLGEFNSACHVRPPLRTQRDRDGLRNGVIQGTIDAICSDHQPHDVDAKNGPFSSTEPGISGLETLLPLTLRLVEEGLIPMSDALARLTCNPARILGIAAGTLQPGAAADICIFDPNEMWEFSTTRMLSHGKNSPFDQWMFKGRVTHTLLGGRVVHG